MIYTLTLNLNIDLVYKTKFLKKDKLNRANLKTLSVGGKGINISRALNNLGIENIAMGFCGGEFNSFILESLNKENIKNNLTSIKNNNRINIKIIEEGKNNVIEINEYGPRILKKEFIVLLENIENIIKPGDFFILAGSLPQDIDENTYGKLIKKLSKKNIKIMLDTSGKPLKTGISASPSFLKINLDELLSINQDNNLESILKSYITQGISKIIITDGSRKAIYYDGINFLEAFPPKVKGLNTVGAGDSVDAGFIYSIIKNYDPLEALKFSISCGSANLLTETPGEINISDIHKIKKDLKIKAIK